MLWASQKECVTKILTLGDDNCEPDCPATVASQAKGMTPRASEPQGVNETRNCTAVC